MKILTLTLENFRPYFGRHDVDLSPASGNSFVVVQGENQSGKTAIFLALYWCLYGQAKNRHGAVLQIFERDEEENDYLFNRKAAEAGHREMKVEIVFTHEGREWQLTRVATCDKDPLDGGEFTTQPFLNIGNEPITTAEIERTINDVLHQEAAQFYFFDGELLTEYEKWLADPETAKKRVREAIERTVGISAFRLGRHVSTVAEEFRQELAKADRKVARNQEHQKELDRLIARRGEIQSEIQANEAQIKELEVEANRVMQIHGDLAAWREAVAKISSLDDRVTAAQEKQASTERKIQQVVRDKYALPLSSLATEVGAELLALIETSLTSPRYIAQASLDNDKCAACSRDLDDIAKKHLATLVGAGDTWTVRSVDDLREAVSRLERCNDFLDPTALALLDQLEADLVESRIEIETCEEEARRLRTNHTVRGDYETEMRKLDEINRRIVNLQGAIREAKKDLEGFSADIRKLDNKIARSSSADPALRRQSRASALAAEAFTHALNLFAERARERVQAGATEAFKALVKNEGYDGIQISEDFVVRPLDSNGKIQTAPSSGGQQLLTLALIAGLNSAAVHNAPIVMDTPFARLDIPNRQRILRWATKLVSEQEQQVVLMVHSGELTRENLKAWQVTPGRLYQIEPTELHGHEVVPTP